MENTNTKSRGETRINIRIPDAEKESLRAISKRLNVTSTFIVREAVKQKINELNAKMRAMPVEEVTI